MPMPQPITTPPPWPYPFWIAHRGAGNLAPENTLAAFRLGAQHGYRMVECDAQLSADGVPFLMHDVTLARTTNAPARLGTQASALGGEHSWAELSAAELSWAELSQFDAGSWHSRLYAGESLLTLENAIQFCRANGLALNIEIKPSPGTERRTGEVVAAHAARLWRDAAMAPLLTSFSPEALRGARQGAPDLPRGLLLNTLTPDRLDTELERLDPERAWLEHALALGCVAVVCHHPLWDSASVARAHGAGLRALSYTVNDQEQAKRLIALCTDGIITDRIDLFSPA